MKRNLSLVLLVLILIVSTVQFVQSDNAKQNDFVTNFINNVPQPQSNDFKSPADVISAFFTSVNSNDMSTGLKCFPIVEDYKLNTVDTYFETTGLYMFQPDAPITGNDSRNLMVSFNRYFSMWQKCYMTLYYFSNPNIKDLAITKDSKNYKDELNRINSMKVTKFFSKPVVEKEQNMELNAREKSMGITSVKLLTVSIKAGDNSINELLIKVGKIKDNWRILFITF